MAMTAVQLTSVMLQLMMVGPDTPRVSEWYIGAWERVRAFFVRNRELNATVMQAVSPGCSPLTQHSSQGELEDIIQLEEGLRGGDDSHAGHDVDSLTDTDVSNGTGWVIPGRPEYVRLQHGQIIGRQHGSWEV
jgi:hypothetical protein